VLFWAQRRSLPIPPPVVAGAAAMVGPSGWLRTAGVAEGVSETSPPIRVTAAIRSIDESAAEAATLETRQSKASSHFKRNLGVVTSIPGATHLAASAVCFAQLSAALASPGEGW